MPLLLFHLFKCCSSLKFSFIKPPRVPLPIQPNGPLVSFVIHCDNDCEMGKRHSPSVPQLPRLQTRIINNATFTEWCQGLHELIYLNILVPDIKASAHVCQPSLLYSSAPCLCFFIILILHFLELKSSGDLCPQSII